jgi:hypothetical protein
MKKYYKMAIKFGNDMDSMVKLIYYYNKNKDYINTKKYCDMIVYNNFSEKMCVVL